jgi:hypothetical protein
MPIDPQPSPPKQNCHLDRSEPGSPAALLLGWEPGSPAALLLGWEPGSPAALLLGWEPGSPAALLLGWEAEWRDLRFALIAGKT